MTLNNLGGPLRAFNAPGGNRCRDRYGKQMLNLKNTQTSAFNNEDPSASSCEAASACSWKLFGSRIASHSRHNSLGVEFRDFLPFLFSADHCPQLAGGTGSSLDESCAEVRRAATES